MARSIADVSAKVTADASQFVSEFRRADNEAKRSAGRIDAEVGKLAKDIKKKFSGSDIGKSLLGGLGLGSGFAVAQTIADTVVNHWREAAEAAQAVEAASAAILRDTRAIIALRQTPEQQLESMEKQLAQLDAEIADKRKTLDGREWRATPNGALIYDHVQSDDTIKAQAALEIERSALNRQIEEMRHRLAEAEQTKLAKEAEKLADETAKQAAERSKQQEADVKEAVALQLDLSGALTAASEAMAKQDENTEHLAEGFRRMVSPSREYMQQIEQVNALLAANKLTTAEATEAIEKLRAAAVDAELKYSFGDILEQSQDQVRTAAEEFQAHMDQMWNTVSDRAGQAFGDMVLQGKASFADLATIVARSMIEIAARMAFVNPLLNAAFGSFSGWSLLPAFFGRGAGGKADGGDLAAGEVSWVGERGKELFVPDRPGKIITHGESLAMTSGGARGDTYHIDARGADVAQIKRLEAMLVGLNNSVNVRAVAANRDAIRRGKLVPA